MTNERTIPTGTHKQRAHTERKPPQQNHKHRHERWQNAPTELQAQTQTEAQARRQKPHRRADQPSIPTRQTNAQGRQGRTNSRREPMANRPDRTTNSRREPSAKPRDRTASPAPHRAPNRPAANPAANTGALLPHTERPAEPETGIRRVYPYIGHRAALETRRSQRGSARIGHSAGAVSRRRRQSCRASRPRRHSPGDAPRGGSIRRCR